MATGLVALLDDVAMLADDTAMAARQAGAATAPILGDDVAVNAGAATGFSAKRELVVIKEIAKGAIKNKFIILPFAFLLSYYLPIAITLVLIAGGIFLLYEGGEKIEEYLHIKFQDPETQAKHETELSFSTPENVLDVEKKKIKSAILTDFILSIEIIVIAMSSVMNESLPVQIGVVTAIALVAVFGVYGLVALIVRMDDLGFYLKTKGKETVGQFFIDSMPKVIKFLTVIGTVAMLLVGGGILVHNIPMIHDVAHFSEVGIINEGIVGIIGAAIVLVVVEVFEKIKEKVGK
jgi:predicted DNA repair protein MutK